MASRSNLVFLYLTNIKNSHKIKILWSEQKTSETFLMLTFFSRLKKNNIINQFSLKESFFFNKLIKFIQSQMDWKSTTYRKRNLTWVYSIGKSRFYPTRLALYLYGNQFSIEFWSNTLLPFWERLSSQISINFLWNLPLLQAIFLKSKTKNSRKNNIMKSFLKAKVNHSNLWKNRTFSTEN